MSETAQILKAEIREETGKESARALRKCGKVPAIIYGNKEKEVQISLDAKELTLTYGKGNFKSTVVEIDAGKDKYKVIPRDVQIHPVTDKIIHADFQFISDDSTVRVNIRVEFHNADKSPGLKRGGVLNVVRHEVELLCPANSIPLKLHADIGEATIGDSIHISDVNLPDDATPTITDRDFTIATIVGRTAKEEEVVVVAEGEEEGEEGEEGAEGAEESSDEGE